MDLGAGRPGILGATGLDAWCCCAVGFPSVLDLEMKSLAIWNSWVGKKKTKIFLYLDNDARSVRVAKLRCALEILRSLGLKGAFSAWVLAGTGCE
jgi:hypothetical protein